MHISYNSACTSLVVYTSNSIPLAAITIASIWNTISRAYKSCITIQQVSAATLDNYNFKKVQVMCKA